ncbi:MAG: hypothetical protein J6A30_08445 [Ruminococcus sp.]|nr:hypothetical protein [Ruminococcus sp.]
MNELVKIEKNHLTEIIASGKTVVEKPFRNDIYLMNSITQDGDRVKNIKAIFEDTNIGDRVKIEIASDGQNSEKLVVKDKNYCYMGVFSYDKTRIIINLMHAGKKMYGIVKNKIPPKETPPDGTSESEIEIYSFLYADYRFSIDIYMED